MMRRKLNQSWSWSRDVTKVQETITIGKFLSMFFDTGGREDD